MTGGKGYRGYIGSRPYFGSRAPQHIQNQVIREYAAANELLFKLSLSEYCFAGSDLMFHRLMGDLGDVDGVIFYSLFLLPESRQLRSDFYDSILRKKISFHCAVEKYVIEDAANFRQIEEIWRIQETLPFCAHSIP